MFYIGNILLSDFMTSHHNVMCLSWKLNVQNTVLAVRTSDKGYVLPCVILAFNSKKRGNMTWFVIYMFLHLPL